MIFLIFVLIFEINDVNWSLLIGAFCRYFSFLIISSSLSILLLKCFIIIAAVNVAVPAPDIMYPPQTKSILFNFPRLEEPSTA